VELMGKLREIIVYMRNTPWRMYCMGLDVLYDVFIARHAHPCVCASEKGKPVVRRGRKALGPPRRAGR
jgi:hypothetical protein